MQTKRTEPLDRRGVTLILALVIIAILGILIASLPSLQFTARRALERQHHARQAAHLARSGVELAVAEVVAGRHERFSAAYELMETAGVKVEVMPGAEGDTFYIHSEATYPIGHHNRAVREVMRGYRLVRDGDGAAVACRFLGVFDPSDVDEPTPFHEAAREKRAEERKALLAMVRERLLNQGQAPSAPPQNAEAQQGLGQAAPRSSKDQTADNAPTPSKFSNQANLITGQGNDIPWLIPLLIELLRDTEPRVRSRAAQALGNHVAERRIVEALREALGDSDEEVRKAAGASLRKLDPAVDDAVEVE